MYNIVSEKVAPIVEKFPVTKTVQTSFLDEAGRPLMREVTVFEERQIGGASVPLSGLKDVVEKEGRLKLIKVDESAKQEVVRIDSDLLKFTGFLKESETNIRHYDEKLKDIKETKEDNKKLEKKALEDLFFVLENTSFCALGKSVVWPFRSLITKLKLL